MYGILIASAILFNVLASTCLAKKENLKSEIIYNAAVFSIFFGIIGARLYHVAHFIEIYSTNPLSILYISNGGIGIIGGLIFGGIAFAIYLKIQRQKISKWFDIVALFMPLSQTIGRIGNIINNELLPYAYYEIVFNLINFAALAILYKKSKLKSGSIALLYLIFYSITRISLENTELGFWKINNVGIASVVATIIMILSICYLIYINLFKKTI